MSCATPIEGKSDTQEDDAAPGKLVEMTLPHQDMTREHILYLPSSYSKASQLPLLFVFHGGGGSAKKVAGKMGFKTLAEKNNFIAVYPSAIDRHWNDGRSSEVFKEHDAKIDDVDYILTLLENLKTAYSIDPDRIYATGFSNGAIFANRLAVEHSSHFAAIAPVIGSIAGPIADAFNPADPVSVLIMNGTDDPMVPYEGGQVKANWFPGLSKLFKRKIMNRGTVVSVAKSIQLWTSHNKIAVEPIITQLPDADTNDGATIEKQVWQHPHKPISVVLYKVIGGGHTFPGGKPYLPKRVVGETCRDINGAEIIWDFLSRHKKIRKP